MLIQKLKDSFQMRSGSQNSLIVAGQDSVPNADAEVWYMVDAPFPAAFSKHPPRTFGNVTYPRFMNGSNISFLMSFAISSQSYFSATNFFAFETTVAVRIGSSM